MSADGLRRDMNKRRVIVIGGRETGRERKRVGESCHCSVVGWHHRRHLYCCIDAVLNSR